jgi:hypothetical protein
MVTLDIPTSSEGFTINLVSGEWSTAPGFGDIDGWDVNISTRMLFLGNPEEDNGFVFRVNRERGVNNLPLGFEVGPFLVSHGSYIGNSGPTVGKNNDYAWDIPGDSNYVGVRFLNEATGDYHFGWMRFCLSGALDDQPRSLVEYAYESAPNTAIDVGEGGVGAPSDCGGGGTGCVTRAFCSDAAGIQSSTINCLQLHATTGCSTLSFDREVGYGVDPLYACWENVTMQGPTVGRQLRVAFFGLGGPFDVNLRTLVLRDVNLNSGGQRFEFPQGTDIALTLENASVLLDPKPVWPVSSPLTLEAISGDNVINKLGGNLDAPTALTVAGGATLRFFGCGIVTPDLPDDQRCYFKGFPNSADIEGVLDVDESWVIFATGDDNPMRVVNGGKIRLSTSSSVLETGSLVVDGGSIEMPTGTVRVDRLKLDNASLLMETAARILTGNIQTLATGHTSTVTLGSSPADATTRLIADSAILVEATDTLTLAGYGRAVTQSLILSPAAHVQITESAALAISGPFPSQWSFTNSSIAIDPAALLSIQSSGGVSSDIPIHNDGTVLVEGTFKPRGEMSGGGILRVASTGTLGPLGPDAGWTFTASPRIILDPLSTFKVVIAPTTGQTQKLIANTSFSISKLVGVYLDPIIYPTQDLILAPGTKFAIVDYPDGNDLQGLFIRADFSKIREGDEIKVGVNTYRISYLDPDYDPNNQSVITLTVVDPTATKANDDYYTALQDTMLDVSAPGVLDNDVNVSGDATLWTPPTHGNVTFNTDGSFTYVPDPLFTGDDSFTYVVGSSNVATVFIHVRAQDDCTLSSGYWKAHAGAGGALFDTTWLQLPNGPATSFFLSDANYLHVLSADTEGNPYYILAQQHIAAELNFLRGADSTAVQGAFDAAKLLFEHFTPDEVMTLQPSDPLHQEFISLAATLDDYNNGLLGPGTCIE